MADPNASSVYTSRGQVEGEDWPAVAGALNAQMAAKRIGQQELAQLSGVSVSTVRQIQHGAGRRVQNKTLAAISRALDWPEDHLTRILLAGRHPLSTVVPDSSPDGEVLATLRRVEGYLRDLTTRVAYIESVMKPTVDQVGPDQSLG